ncbi:Peptidylglycine alpha-hydroxylating monooxygenase, partial [Orchesella cincta]
MVAHSDKGSARTVLSPLGVLDLSILIPYGKPDMPDAYLYGCTEPGLINEQVWNCGDMGGDDEDVLYRGESLLSGSICSEGQQRILYAWAKKRA